MHNLELSSENLDNLQERLKSEKNNKIYRRLQCIHFKSIGFKHNLIASSLGVNVDTVTDWIKLYNSKGFNGLCQLEYEGRRVSKLDSVSNDMREYINNNMIDKLSQLQDYLLNTHNIFVEQSWLYRYCKKNSIHLTRKHD